MDVKNKEKAPYVSLLNWVALAVGLCSMVAAVWLVNLHNDRQITEHANELADRLAILVEERFNRFEYGLRGARGAVISPGVDNVTRARFKRYADSRDIEREFPGALGFGFIRRVSVDQEARFVERARADGAPDFTIRTLTPHFDDRFIIQYIYPQQVNEEAVGLDIGSESNRRKAALEAARTGQPQLTAPITLVQADGKPRRGFLVLLPIYRTPTMPDTSEARIKAVAGWAYAPLIVDDVLENLGPVIDQVSLTLTDPDEGTPFYESDHEALSFDGSKEVVRSIHVLGQSWQMSVGPRASMLQPLQLWSPWWAIGLGLTITCLALWFSFQWSMKLDSEEELAESEDAQSFQSFHRFLHSEHFHRSWPPAVLAFTMVFLGVGWFLVESRVGAERQSLVETNDRAVGILKEVVASQSSNVLALASNSSVESLLNSASRQEEEKWREQIANIFSAFMLASPEVHQARLIEARGGWRESVRIERSSGQIRAVGRDQMQIKAGEPYIERTITLDSGEVYVSEINLNRERGAVERPYRPVWRFATPLFYEDGRVFGIVIINMNAGKLLDSLGASVPESIDLLITNRSGDYLLHPRADKGFAFDLGRSERWQDEFANVDAWWPLPVQGLSQWQSPRGVVWGRQSDFKLGDQSLLNAMKVFSVAPQFPIYESLFLQLMVLLIALAALGVVALTVQFLTWRVTQIRNWEAHLRFREQQRKKESALFEALVDSAPDATLIMDEQGIIELVNMQAQSLFGYSRAELVGMSISRLMPDNLSKAHDFHVTEYLKNPKRRAMGDAEADLLGCRADGSQFPVEVSFGPVQMEDRLLVSASVRDITQRLIAEQKLRDALKEAEKATEAKTAFLANTSHEIRTPLNAVIGLSHLLSEESLSDSQQQLVQKITVAGRSLLGIVNDVLDLSKIEVNEMSVEQVPVELRELLEEVGGVFLPEAESKKLRYRLEVDSRLPPWVLTDGTRLRQILVNLLGNAIKFTHMGGVTLKAELIEAGVGPGPEQQCLRLSVQDTGIGIPPEVQTRLFQPFAQADVSTTRSFGGTGLGLSIVRSLANLLGGEAGVLSQEGEGSTFFVDVPLKEVASEDVLALDHRTSELFVMVVESDPEEGRKLEAMTRALGWRSQTVNDNNELMQTVRKRRETGLRVPDAVISSQQLQIREGDHLHKTDGPGDGQDALPVVLLASADHHEEMELKAAGSATIRIVGKPLDASVLFDAVNDVVTQHTGNNTRVLQSTRTETVRAQWLPGVRVLVVDDSAINLDVVSQILSRNGASVETVISGREALDRLKSGAADFDIVLMDVQMPVMDGLEATRQARDLPGLQSLPIIALTAGALLEERQRALEAGMNDFLTKPIDPSQLINRIRIAVEAYRGTSLKVTPEDSAEPDSQAFPEIPGLNTEKAKRLLLGNCELFMVTLDGLLREYSNLAQPPLDGLDDQDAYALRQTLAAQIHKLRNVSGLVGAEHISKVASEAENILRNERESASGVLVQLAESLNQLRDSSAAIVQTWSQRLAARSTAPEETEAFPPLDTDVLRRLGNLLLANDLAALDEVSKLGPLLESAMGAEAFRKFNDSLMRLDFRQAAEFLKTSDEQGNESLANAVGT